MAREDVMRAMADIDADDRAFAALMDIDETTDAARYGLADLVGEISREDVNGLKARIYKSWCDAIVDETSQEDRNHYYRTGLMVGTVAEMARWYKG